MVATFCQFTWPQRRVRRSYPYFWTIVSLPEERAERLREELKATARIILIALVIDTIEQVIELKTSYPAEVPFVACC